MIREHCWPEFHNPSPSPGWRSGTGSARAANSPDRNRERLAMNAASKKGTTERGYSPKASCKDSFRFRLVGKNGRHRFASVRFVGAEGCASDDLAAIAAAIEGRWLDEVDVEALGRMECRGERCRGCPQEAAEVISAIREVLLPE